MNCKNQNNIRLFASDLDGTLLNARHEMDEHISSGIDKLLKSGKVFSVATGRPTVMVNRKDFPGCYISCMNGALILDPEDTIVFQAAIDPDLLRKLIHDFPELPFEFCHANDIECVQSLDQVYEAHQELSRQGKIPFFIGSPQQFGSVRSFDKTADEILSRPVLKVNCIHTTPENEQLLADWIQENPGLLDAPSAKFLHEITAEGIDKAYGVHALAKILGLQDDQCAVFGDGGNDICMLEHFKNSYCPSNGIDPAKQAARHVIGPSKDYSVIDTMLEIAGIQTDQAK